MSHIPVLLNETLEFLDIKDGMNILDCTFGGGGHTTAILESANVNVTAIDRDPDAAERTKGIKGKYQDRFNFIESKFSKIGELFQGKKKFDAVLFDFGVSSFQLDIANRGFSFQKDGPLDMRMSKSGISAEDVINSYSENDLAYIIKMYGDEQKSKKIATAIVNARKEERITTTLQLRNVIHSVFPVNKLGKKHSNIDVATKTFQAIRIYVNDEIREIHEALVSLPLILNNKARIAMISFHSLEDTVVKNFGKSMEKCFSAINKKVIKASEAEILKNPRARSAILRGFVYNENKSLG